MLIFEQSRAGRLNPSHTPVSPAVDDLPAGLLRQQEVPWPQVSELQVVRHYTRLSQKNFSVDTHFYPLGSCTMKYNPRICHRLASLQGFLERHPLAPASHGQGVLACLYELQEMLQEITGLAGFALSPMAGAQGEYAGVAMIRAYHQARQDHERQEFLIPDSAHGTNPATAAMCGFQVREIPSDEQGDVDLDALRQAVGPRTAGIMLTNPSTLGVFERKVLDISSIVHQAGGLLYYDGANLNAIAGRVRPGDMGFDAVHLNLHKTFATPHGSGGPGAGPVGVSQRLLPFLPVPRVTKTEAGYGWITQDQQAVGPLSTFMGNVGILLRAYAYIRLLGKEGIHQVGRYATLNANYLQSRLREAGFQVAFPDRPATHEFIVTLQREAREYKVTALDFAKRLLDYGIHAPTIYFPMLVPECLLIEPTETESKETLDRFVEAMIAIRQEAMDNPQQVKNAPHTMPVGRLDEATAARKPDLVWQG
ncbi:MAG: glycine dehydrogenase subunit 2 [Magnetococcales bacterium]|nr:aminomethyl-transferring glycine dehydrogenase subunit GcvPB [Magnetococcales bacterium]NGZ29631.1 glycine dehydrogenase subunit 2 [Magnetococcales bacterium]